MQKIPISQIKENPRNPRKISKEKFAGLVDSIRNKPWAVSTFPLIIGSDNIILSGNMRLKAMKELGYDEAYVIFADNLTKEQQKELVVMANAHFGVFDFDILSADYGIDDLQQMGLDPKDLGIQGSRAGDDDDMQDGNRTADDESPTQPGDIYDLEGHQLIVGDMNTDAVDKMITRYCKHVGKYDIVRNGEIITWSH